MSRHQVNGHGRLKKLVVPLQGFCHAMQVELKEGRPMDKVITANGKVETAAASPAAKVKQKRKPVPAEVLFLALEHMRAAKNDLDGLTRNQIMAQLEKVTGYNSFYPGFVDKWAKIVGFTVRRERVHAHVPSSSNIVKVRQSALIEWLHLRLKAIEDALGVETPPRPARVPEGATYDGDVRRNGNEQA